MCKSDHKEEVLFRHCKPRVLTKREVEPPLPFPFELPRNFPAIVMNDLKRNMLTVTAKPKFISCVAASIFRFKSYPSDEEYGHVAQSIIEKFPFLRSSNGSGCVSLHMVTH